ncbi:unnamed protein product, partial [Brassica oleracea var. botrytis]
TKSTSVIAIHINKSIKVGGSTRGLMRRGDWRSLFCSITELPQTKLLKSATLDCSLLKVEAERTDSEAGGEEGVQKKTEPEAGEDGTSRRLEIFFFTYSFF